MQEKRIFMHYFRINIRFWCGRKERSDGIARYERPGIEDADPPQKSFIYKAFFN